MWGICLRHISLLKLYVFIFDLLELSVSISWQLDLWLRVKSEKARDKRFDNWWFFTGIFYKPRAQWLAAVWNAFVLHFMEIVKSNNK